MAKAFELPLDLPKTGFVAPVLLTGLIGLAVLITSAIAFPSGSDLLTKAQKKAALAEIDAICGDTWCEGDFGFKFRDIECNSSENSCKVLFEMSLTEIRPGGQQGVGGEVADSRYSSGVVRRYEVFCTIHGLKKYEDLVETRSGGHQGLTDFFYARLTDCIGDLEKTLRSAI